MTSKYRFRNKYRLEIRERDHGPMHAHLTGGGLHVVIALDTLRVIKGEAPASLLWEVLQWMYEHQETLIQEWKTWHP